jgi:hypothetical protein
MRTIFITPLLWKRLDRAALRRGEEGQALVLIAFVVIAMVGMVGLAIDGGLGYLESTRLQRAADAAALAGVSWIPDYRQVADGRARLAAEANGIKVACPAPAGGSASGEATAEERRCRSASWEQMTAAGPGRYFTFESWIPPSQGGVRYAVRLGTMQQRYFMGVLGIPNFPVVRTSIGTYSRLVRFGSSFNYHGSNGVLHDHYMRCDEPDPADCEGTTESTLSMYGATYQKYVVMRCEQPNPPNPCIGGFWAHIAGPSTWKRSGDAFNTVKMGMAAPSGSNNYGGSKIGNNDAMGRHCMYTQDPQTWFINRIFAVNGEGCPAVSSGLPARNPELHPDRVGNNFPGFGYEVAVEVKPGHIWTIDDTRTNVMSHTNLNVTIYDGALSELGAREQFGTSDNYQGQGNLPDRSDNYTDYELHPYVNFNREYFQYGASATITRMNWAKKVFECSPKSTSNCTDVALSPAGDSTMATPPREFTDGITTVDDASIKNDWRKFPDTNNVQNYTYNDMRMRFTLYFPPNNNTIPSTFANVQGNPFDSFEMTDMSVRKYTEEPDGSGNRDFFISNPNIGANVGIGEIQSNRYSCYVIFDDQKAFWANTRDTNRSGTPPSGAVQYRDWNTSNGFVHQFRNASNGPILYGTGPDFAYTFTFNNVNNPPINNGVGVRPSIERYAYVCGPTDLDQTSVNKDLDNVADERWNSVLGTPTGRYGSFADSVNDRSIAEGILDTRIQTPEGYVFFNSLTAGTTVDYSRTVTALREVMGRPIVSKLILDRAYSAAGAPVTSFASGNPKTTGAKTIWDAPTATYQQIVDPFQDCRRSAVEWEPTKWPIDPYWGHNRIPFNMAYGDPLTNKAWITNTSWINNATGYANIPNPVASGAIAGYYTLYYSFHGWRCQWDFDSNYTHNPRKFPYNPANAASLSKSSAINPSLTHQRRNTLNQALGRMPYAGEFDRAFTLGHPGLASNAYMREVLRTLPLDPTQRAVTSDAVIDRELLPVYYDQSALYSKLPSDANRRFFGQADLDLGLQPYFHLTNVRWNTARTALEAKDLQSGDATVRPGVYMLHVQAFGGEAANRFSIKAEYENPRPVRTTLSSGQVVTVIPVPNVYAITTMAIYANATRVNDTGAPAVQRVIFDLAYIPPENAGTQAILQIFDTGDVSGALDIGVLEPSGWGPKIKAPNGTDPKTGTTWNWSVVLGNYIPTRLSGCPFSLNIGTIGTSYSCYAGTGGEQNKWTAKSSGEADPSRFNGQWMQMTFNIPQAGKYAEWRDKCAGNGVPEDLCYYYQVSYEVTDRANDTTTWMLLVQPQPIRLVIED